MIKWEFLQPRNLFAIMLFSLIAYAIFNHFSKGDK